MNDYILFPVRGIQIATLMMVIYALITVIKMYGKSNGWRPYLISIIILLAHETIYFIVILSYLLFNNFFSRIPASFTDWSVGLRFHEIFVISLVVFAIKRNRDRR